MIVTAWMTCEDEFDVVMPTKLPVHPKESTSNKKQPVSKAVKAVKKKKSSLNAFVTPTKQKEKGGDAQGSNSSNNSVFIKYKQSFK